MPPTVTPLTIRTERLIAAALAMLLLMGVSPLIDLAVVRTPAHFGEAPWRYQTFLLLLSSAPQLAMVLGVMLALAVLAGRRAVVRGVSAALLVCALVYLIVIPLFGLDFLTIRRLVAQASKRSVDFMALKTILFSALIVLVELWTGCIGWVASAPAADTVAREKGHGLVVGQAE